MDLRAVAMGVGFAMLWASAFTSTRIIVLAAPPLTALVIRFVLSGIIGIAIARAMGQNMRLTRDEWRTLILFGICQNALYLGLNWEAMRTVEASAASIVASTMPLLVALFGWVAFGERLRAKAVAGLLAGVIGVGIIMGVRLQHGLDPFGTFLSILGVIALTLATLSVRKAGSGRNVMMIVALQMLVGAAALLLPALALEDPLAITWSWELVGAFLFTVLGPGLLATWIWFLLVARVGAVRAATFHFLSPIFGVIIAAALLGERFGLTDVIGALVIAGGILLVQLSRVETSAKVTPPPAARHPRP